MRQRRYRSTDRRDFPDVEMIESGSQQRQSNHTISDVRPSRHFEHVTLKLSSSPLQTNRTACLLVQLTSNRILRPFCDLDQFANQLVAVPITSMGPDRVEACRSQTR